MKQKTILTIVAIAGIAYAGIYFYQKKKREESNVKETSYEDALKAIDDL